MPKEFLQVKFKVEKAEDDGNTGYLKGHASIFGNVDLGRDVVEKGAFAKTIKDHGGIFPMLLDHDPTQPAGYHRQTSESDKGLYYEAELKLHDPRVKQRYELAKLSLELGSPMGNSFGYKAIKYEFIDKDTEAGPVVVRMLKELKLYETSLVTFPMNEAAGVSGAKALHWKQLFDRLQSNGYDLDKILKALDALGIKPEQPAAAKETDPELLQSVDNLISQIRA